jgi:hypothetical protein
MKFSHKSRARISVLHGSDFHPLQPFLDIFTQVPCA